MSILSGLSGAPAPQAPAPGARSLLMAGSRVVGDVTAPGLLEVQGRVEGRLSADSVLIEERGEVEGEVTGASVTVRGRFDGTLIGGAVRLLSTARVSGTLSYESLAVESGAEVTATVSRTRVRTPDQLAPPEVSAPAG